MWRRSRSVGLLGEVGLIGVETARVSKKIVHFFPGRDVFAPQNRRHVGKRKIGNRRPAILHFAFCIIRRRVGEMMAEIEAARVFGVFDRFSRPL